MAGETSSSRVTPPRGIRVGTLASDGDRVVYDTEWQPMLPATVRLFSVSQNGWIFLQTESLEGTLTHRAPAAADTADVTRYLRFKSVAIERDETAREAPKIARVRAEAPARKPRPLSPSRQSVGERPTLSEVRVRAERQAHCYSCGRHLNSNDNDVHALCGWLACYCGACGCR